MKGWWISLRYPTPVMPWSAEAETLWEPVYRWLKERSRYGTVRYRPDGMTVIETGYRVETKPYAVWLEHETDVVMFQICWPEWVVRIEEGVR